MSNPPAELPRGLSSLDKVAPDTELKGLADSLGPSDTEPKPTRTSADAVPTLPVNAAPSGGDAAAAKGVLEEATTAPAPETQAPTAPKAASTTSSSAQNTSSTTGAKSAAPAPAAASSVGASKGSNLSTGSVADPPKDSQDHLESLVSGLAGIALSAPMVGVEKLSGYASSGISTLKTKADEQGLSGMTNSARDAVTSAAHHPAVAPYLQTASDKATDLSNKAKDTNNYPSSNQVADGAKGLAGSAATLASGAAAAASKNVQDLGAKAGLTNAPEADVGPAAQDSGAVPISKEAQQGFSTHEDVKQPGSAEYGAGTQGSTKPGQFDIKKDNSVGSAAQDAGVTPISKEAQQGFSTHDDVQQPGSAEYGAGIQGSVKPDSTTT